jgi:endo-1,4-beta-xylanase
MNDGPTNCHWWVELEIFWPPTSPTPKAGDVLGFDVAGNDDDTGLRKNQLFWNDSTGNAYLDPTKFGLMQLGS